MIEKIKDRVLVVIYTFLLYVVAIPLFYCLIWADHGVYHVKKSWYRINKISYYEGRGELSPYVRRKTWDSK